MLILSSDLSERYAWRNGPLPLAYRVGLQTTVPINYLLGKCQVCREVCNVIFCLHIAPELLTSIDD